MLLTLEQARQVYDGLKIGYRSVESRMQFGRPQTTQLDKDICQHLVGYKLQPSAENVISMYRDVNIETRQIIDPHINRVVDIINNTTESVEQIFLIMSTNWCGSSRHVKHIHTLLQKDPQRCITLSFPIPLYINPDEPAYHKFYWHYQDELFPKITYTSHVRMEKINVEYSSVDIPKENLMSLKFDSARSPHWIDNTGHLYLWVVCDAVTYADSILQPGLKLDLHGKC